MVTIWDRLFHTGLLVLPLGLDIAVLYVRPHLTPAHILLLLHMWISVRAQRQPDGRIFLHSPYDEKFVDIAHLFPGLHWDKNHRVWVGYQDSVQLLAKRLHEEKVGKLELPAHPIVRDVSFTQVLRDYQKTGVQFLHSTMQEGAFLADVLGLGKTAQTLVAVQNELPAVVICPSVLKSEWVREGKRLGIDVLALSSTKPPNATLGRSDGIITINYDIIHAWYEVLKTAKTVIFDEGQALSNSRSRRSTICKDLSHNAKNRIILTGTPFANRPIELWNLVDTISPGRFGSYVNFGKRYCGGFQEEIEGRNKEMLRVWNFKGHSHIDELNARLKQFMLRRTKKEVALELPDKTRKIIEVDVVKKQVGNIDVRDFDEKWLRYALSISAEAKIDKVVELVKLHLDNGSSIIVGAYHNRVANEVRDALAKELGIEPFLATGEMSVTKRLEEIEKASNSTPCVLVVTTHSVGEGLNRLVFADVAIIVELDHSPRWLAQFEGRLHRPGQKNNVLFEYVIGLGTIDELIRDRVISKIAVVEDALGQGDDLLREDLLNSGDKDVMDELKQALQGLY